MLELELETLELELYKARDIAKDSKARITQSLS